MDGLAFHHVAIAVPSIDAARPLYERLAGGVASGPEVLEDQGVRVAFVGALELLEPLGPDSTVARFLERRGPALHHIAYRTGDIEAELERLRSQGFELLDPEPRSGAGGHRVAFLHPGGTGRVLVELVEENGDGRG